MSMPVMNKSSGNTEDKVNSTESVTGESRRSSNVQSQLFRDTEANILRNNETVILNNMIVTDKLYDALIETNVMIPSLAEEYKKKGDQSNIAREILDHMILQLSTGVVGISAICNAFQGSGHSFLADHIRADASRTQQDTIIDSAQIAKFFNKLPSLIPKDVARDKVLTYLTDKIKEYITRYNWTQDRVREKAEQLGARWANVDESKKQKLQILEKESKIKDLNSQIDEVVSVIDTKSEVLSESAKYLAEMKEIHNWQMKIQMSHNAANDTHLNRLELRQRAQDLMAFQMQKKVNGFLQEMKIRTGRTSNQSLTRQKEKERLINNHEKALFAFDELFEYVLELDEKRKKFEQLVEDAEMVLLQLKKSDKDEGGFFKMGIQKYIHEVEENVYKRSMENRRLQRHVEMCEDEIDELKKKLNYCQGESGGIARMKKDIAAKDKAIKELNEKVFQLRQKKSPKGGKRGTIINIEEPLSPAPVKKKSQGAALSPAPASTSDGMGIVVTQVAEDAPNVGRRVTYYGLGETPSRPSRPKSITGPRKSVLLSKTSVSTLKADEKKKGPGGKGGKSSSLNSERKSGVKFSNVPIDKKEIAEKLAEEKEWGIRQEAFVDYVSDAFSLLQGEKLTELLREQPRATNGNISDTTIAKVLDYITETSPFLDRDVMTVFLDKDKLSYLLDEGTEGESMKSAFVASMAKTKIASLRNEGKEAEATKYALIESVAGGMALLDDHVVFELMENVKGDAVIGHKTKTKFMQFLSDSTLRRLEKEREMSEREEAELQKGRRASKYGKDVSGHLGRNRAKSIKLHAEREQMLATADLSFADKIKYLHDVKKKDREDQIFERVREVQITEEPNEVQIVEKTRSPRYLSPTSAYSSSRHSISPSSLGSFEEIFGSNKSSDISTQWESYLSIESLDAATQYKESDVDSDDSSDDEDGNWIQLDAKVELSATHNVLLKVNPKDRPNDLLVQYLLKINSFALAKLLNSRGTRAKLAKNVIEFALKIFRGLNDFARCGTAGPVPSQLAVVHITEDELLDLNKYLNKKTLKRVVLMSEIHSPGAADSGGRRSTQGPWPTIAGSFRMETPSREVREEIMGRYRYVVNLKNPQIGAHGKTVVAEEMVSLGLPISGKRAQRAKSAFPRLTTVSKRPNSSTSRSRPAFPERNPINLCRRPRPPTPGGVYACW